MARNLVAFADGTGNSAASPFKTNVWRLYQALDLRGTEQLAIFVDGVGTSSIKWLRVFGLALGIGVKRNVLELYKFFCRNHQPGDRIHVFGFSRGAFTARVLVGLIHREGLVTFESEEELERNALAAYRAYRAKAFRTPFPWVSMARRLRDRVVRAWNGTIGARSYREVARDMRDRNRVELDIAFVGVWDTVSAYGLPINELTEAVDRWIWPMSFRDRTLLARVQRARHALSLDDERQTFFPILWTEAARPAGGTLTPDERLVQVWFAGVHANVGGGYPDDSLAHVSLCWMIDEARAAGLAFVPWVVDGYQAVASEMGPIYNSRRSVGTFYRYHPRDIAALMARSETPPDVLPLIDASVVLRMADGNDGYVPVPLPTRALVRAGRDLVALDAKPPARPLDAAVGGSRSDDAGATLQRALAALNEPHVVATRAHWIALVRDTVWWRRVAYFTTLGLCVVAAALPLLAGYLHTRFSDAIDAGASGWVQVVVQLVAGFAPALAAPWLAAIAAHPSLALLIGGAILASLSWSALLQLRIRNRLHAAWSAARAPTPDEIAARRLASQRRVAARGTVIWGALAVVAFLAARSVDGQAAAENATWLTRYGFAAGFAAVALAGLGVSLRRRWRARRAVPFDPSKPGPLLGFARWMRTTDALTALYGRLARTVLPALFLAASALVILFGVNRVAFDIASSHGAFCAPTVTLDTARKGTAVRRPPVRGVETAARAFEVDDPCWASGLIVDEGARYRIWLTLDDTDWFDRTVHTDVEGFSGTLLHTLVTPLKRWWTVDWFQPIARIGARGLDEHVLASIDPLPAQDPAIVARPFFDAQGRLDAETARRETAAAPRNPRRRVLVAEIKPRTTGELFLYVNDAVLGVPGLAGLFYANNRGRASVAIQHLAPPTTPPGPR